MATGLCVEVLRHQYFMDSHSAVFSKLFNGCTVGKVEFQAGCENLMDGFKGWKGFYQSMRLTQKGLPVI
ncbi:unnamed protein product [Urochloa humidicola]